MPEETEPGFTVRDRRRFLSEDSESENAEKAVETPPPAAPPTPSVPPASATPPPAAPSRPVPPPSPVAPATPFMVPDMPQGGGVSGPTGGFFGGQEPGGGMPYSTDEAPVEGFGGMGGPAEYDEQQIPDVYAYLLEFLGLMRAQALLRMGLIANPATGKSERDLEQAQVAIDTAAFLAAQIEPVIAPEERLPLRAMISDLQINFVEQSRRG